MSVMLAYKRVCWLQLKCLADGLVAHATPCSQLNISWKTIHDVLWHFRALWNDKGQKGYRNDVLLYKSLGNILNGTKVACLMASTGAHMRSHAPTCVQHNANFSIEASSFSYAVGMFVWSVVDVCLDLCNLS